MSEEKKMMSVDEMEDAAGGKNHGYGFGFYMTVTDCNGTYLALRNATVYDRNNELAQLYPGYSVFTNGNISQGTGINGQPCYCRYVCFNGIWGWANASFLA